MKWLKMTPAQKQKHVHGISASALHLLGIRILSDYHVYWRSSLPGLLILFYFCSSIYTIQYFVRHGDIMTGLRCVCAAGIPVSVSLYSTFNDFNRII